MLATKDIKTLPHKIVYRDVMPVVAVAFRRIIAERREPKGQLTSLDIDSTPKIINVAEKELAVFENTPSVVMDFDFQTLYQPALGEIRLTGELVYTTKDAKKLVKDWEKNKQLPQDVDAEVKNFLFRKCLTLAINISEQMQLPPPLGFPIIQPQKKDTQQETKKQEDKKADYIG